MSSGRRDQADLMSSEAIQTNPRYDDSAWPTEDGANHPHEDVVRSTATSVPTTNKVVTRSCASPPLRFSLADDRAQPINAGADDLHAALLAGGKTQTALISVIGTSRVGKSWLSSYLLGEEGLFKSKSGIKSTTKGATAVVTDMERFNDRFELINLADDDKLGLVLVDVEAKGDGVQESDFCFPLPFMLTSRAILYVTKQGGTDKNAFLNEMSACFSLATRVVSGLDDEASDSDVPLFGTLLVVVNNVTGDLEEARKELQSWMTEEPTLRLRDEEEKRAAMKRNKMRLALSRAFESIAFHAFPSPSRNASWYEQHAGPFAGLTSEYEKAAQALAQRLQPALRKPRRCSFLDLQPSQLAPMLKKTLEAAFSNKSMEPLASQAVEDTLQLETTLRSISDAVLADTLYDLESNEADIALELKRDAMPRIEARDIRSSQKRLLQKRLESAKRKMTEAAVPERRAAGALSTLTTLLNSLLASHLDAIEAKLGLKRAQELAKKRSTLHEEPAVCKRQLDKELTDAKRTIDALHVEIEHLQEELGQANYELRILRGSEY